MVYLDYNSTTPVDSRVLETMLPYFSEKFGNAASKTHSFGWVAEAAVEQARERVAKLINANPHEIIFTSGATESINLAIKGVWETYSAHASRDLSAERRTPSLCAEKSRPSGGWIKNHIVTVSTEHKAVLDTCKALEQKGAQVTYLPVNREGLIDLQQLKESITERTILVCVMYANNETGVIQPMNEISQIVHERKCLLFSDATQAIGKISVDVSTGRDLSAERRTPSLCAEKSRPTNSGGGIDLLCLSSHKMYGPKGAGALFVRRKNPRVTLSPFIHGGGHEKGLRSGTLNVPAIVGMGKACEIAEKEMQEDAGRISILRDELEKTLSKTSKIFKTFEILPDSRLPNVTNISFHGIKADSLIARHPDIAVSTGSACTSAIPEPSHVLKAMGVSDEMAYSSIRFSLGKFTTHEEIKYAIDKINKTVKELIADIQEFTT